MKSLNLICVICVISVISVLIKKHLPEYSLLLNLSISIIVFLYLAPNIMIVLNQVKNLISVSNVPEKYISVLFKSLGVCFLVQFASDACRDVGETSLSSKIEIIGKILILTFSLPFFNEIMCVITKILGVK